MKNIKKSLVAATLLFSFAGNVMAFEPSSGIQEEDKVGPFESYINCVSSCVDRTEPWSIQRTACAIDCYVILTADIVGLFS
jgi:hypothetical protein